MDSAATVPGEVREAELVLAVMDSWALGFPLESFLLERFSVNLVNANKAANKIPIFLIQKSAIACRPDQIARRLWMIGIVHKIAINPGIRR